MQIEFYFLIIFFIVIFFFVHLPPHKMKATSHTPQTIRTYCHRLVLPMLIVCATCHAMFTLCTVVRARSSANQGARRLILGTQQTQPANQPPTHPSTYTQLRFA